MKYEPLPSLEQYLKETEEGILCKHTHPLYPNLVGFKYSKPTVYLGNWTDCALRARGIAFDMNTGLPVARPWDKFFNYEELIQRPSLREKLERHPQNPCLYPNMTGKFRVSDKLDGSLGILYCYDGQWLVKTAGFFTSAEANWANERLSEFVNLSNLNTAYTYLFEIIWLSAPTTHPLTRFYNEDGLVLIGVVNTQTGEEVLDAKDLETIAEEIGTKCAQNFVFDDFQSAVTWAKERPKDKEGVVITFDSGFKVKIKGKEFLELQSMFHNIDKSYIIDQLVNGKVKEIMDIPEELPDMKQFAENLEAIYQEKLAMCQDVAAGFLLDKMERKDVYQAVISKDDLRPFTNVVMRMVYGGKLGFDETFRRWAHDTLTP